MTRFDPRQVGWRLGGRTNPAAGSCGCRGTAPPASSARKAPARPSTCSPRPARRPRRRPGHPHQGRRPAAVHRAPLQPTTGRASCSTRSGSPPACPSWCGTPSPAAWTPWSPRSRAKAFTAGTVNGAGARGQGDDAARFYAAEAAKVIQAYFHAAALTGRTLDDVLRWVANPVAAAEPTEILREHPHAAPFWHGLLHGALHGDDRTAGNTITTVQQAMALFFQEDIRRRCVPGPGRPATDLADVIDAGGTIYLLGRESPYESASPLMTAVAEHVLDTALDLATGPGGGGCARRCSPASTSCPPPHRCPPCGPGWPTNAPSGLSFI